LVAPAGILILSGILQEQSGTVRAAAQAKGLEFIEQVQMGDWVAPVLRK
jgi:ribosomal protein L11 methylase PrmA